MQTTETRKKVNWKGIGEGLGAVLSLSIIVFSPAIILNLHIRNMSSLPTHYASAVITDKRFDFSPLPLLSPNTAYLFLKGEDLPLKGAVLRVSSEQYATMSVGDKVCMSYKTVSQNDAQTFQDIAPMTSCNK